MHFHQTLGKRQADADPADRALRATADLREDFKDPGEIARWNANPIVPDRHDDVCAMPFGDELNATSRRSELGGVAQQVGKDLRQTDRISLDVNRLLGKTDRQFMRLGLDDGMGRLDGALDDACQADRFLLKVKLVAQ